jgi:hypothetical protein
MTTWIGLGLAFVSALAVNWAYTQEHDAAASLPPLSLRTPRRSLVLLLGSRAWLRGFGTETAGWIVYVASLRLAPLALVQAVGASGIAVLAVVSAKGHPSRLARREQLAVVVAVVGLLLLSLSLVGTPPSDHLPRPIEALVWLGGCGALALFLSGAHTRIAPGAALGLAAGVLFAGGDISSKLVVHLGWWTLAVVSLVISYALGTSVLQGAFQRGDALTTAGMATLATNTVPIVAGFVLFGEALPSGARGALQIAAFASLVVSATLLGRPGVGGGSRDERRGYASDTSIATPPTRVWKTTQ